MLKKLTLISIRMVFSFLIVGFHQPAWATDEVPPTRALVIFTREAWGCPRSQEIKEDVTGKLAQEDGNSATIEEVKNPEDVANRYELCLMFPAKPLNQLPGYFVVKFWCIEDHPKRQATLSMDWAGLKRKRNHWVVSSKVKVNGFVRVQMLYSRTPEIRKAWFSCQETEIDPRSSVSYFNAYPLEGEFLGIPKQKMSGEWQTLELTIDPFFLNGSIAVDKCQVLLEELDKEFALSGSPLLWDIQKVRPETIRGLAKRDKEKSFHVLIKVNFRTVVLVGVDNFLPHLRQKIALKKPDGKLVGAELWIRAEP